VDQVRRGALEGLERAMNDDDPQMWDIPEHTRAKHQILDRYLGGWYPILSKFNKRVLYIDGFAGRGRYNDGTEGSPLVALRRLLDHRHLPAMQNTEFVFLFVEHNKSNADSLQDEINKLKAQYPTWPSNIRETVMHSTFEQEMESIVDLLREQKKRLAPAFIFVDPFGWTRFPMTLLGDLMQNPKSEIFVNFMVGHVMRFADWDQQSLQIEELFGIPQNEVMTDYVPGTNRVEYLRGVYVRELSRRAGFKYMQSFAMINHTGNISYYLVYGTKDPTGMKKMKDAMWHVDPVGDYTFSDRIAGQNVLFTPDPDLRPLDQELLRHYAGRTGVTADEMGWHAVLHTPYRETHVRPRLKILEDTGQITVIRPPGKRQFSAGVVVSFPPIT
jgi:three-Cys-motif partner protein